MSPYTVVAGAGLTGSLAAVRLARAGHRVELVEKRPDLRSADHDQGRSINLALSTRGIDALERVGLAEQMLAGGIPMRGRMMHATDGALTFQPYGRRPEHSIVSVSRDDLNRVLLDAADAEAAVTTHFGRGVVDVDPDGPRVTVGTGNGDEEGLDPELVVGADGAYSAVRRQLLRHVRSSYSEDELEHGYKELTIPPSPGGSHRLDPNALHIWPRGSHMMIALPNPDGSFTCTLFWPFDGPIGFERIDEAGEVTNVFASQFPDALELMPDLSTEYLTNPTSTLVTIRCRPWHYRDTVILLGDAGHAVVPFYGQGANAALEDVTILMDELAAGHDRATAFEAFFETRKPDADALADLALDNFVEMRDRVASRWFLATKRVKAILADLLPGRFEPLYTMVTFSRRPYAEAVAKAERQDRWLAAGVGLIVASLVAGLVLLVIALS